MAPETDCSAPMARLNSVSAMEDRNGDVVGNSNQWCGRPPRDHSTLRYCNSSTWLAEPVSIIIMHIVCKLLL